LYFCADYFFKSVKMGSNVTRFDRIRTLGVVVLFFLCSILVQAQDIESIKNDPNYIWGQGVGATLRAADDNAVKDLISQITVNVESSTQTTVSNQQSGQNVQSSISTTGDLKVSSSVSLSNCQRLVASEGKSFVVLRYVAREEIDKMFQVRIDKIWDLVAAGERADELNKVSDVLRNYYWALKVLSSLPAERRAMVVTNDGIFLSTELRERITRAMDDIQLTQTNITQADDQTEVTLLISYKGAPATVCDYSFFDGYDWLQASAKDGLAVVEMPLDAKQLRLRIEYEYRALWKSDPIVNEMLTQLPNRLPFPQYEKVMNLSSAATLPVIQQSLQVAEPIMMHTDSIATCSVQEMRTQQDVVGPVLDAIESRNYGSVRSYFTDNGWLWFEKLIKYGNAKIIARSELQVSAFANGYLVRGVKANFRFKSNNKSFVEDLVFYVKDHQIDGINFGLDKGALEDICRHSMWQGQSRLVLVNFLESYKTAYALERLDYLNAIFSDDALIIVGTKLPETRVSEVMAMDEDSYRHNRLTKSEYIQNLERVFAKQEYVNIQFEDASVKKTSRNSERYEIIIKQNYFSTSYADKGYLFLLADISDPEKPIIHVRVWDENKNNLMDYGEWIY